jgi:nucleoside-diphosphate kinase
MAGRYTLTMIKPTAMRKGYAGAILHKITEEGKFRIAAMKMVKLSEADAKEFYIVHKDKSFYNDLVKFMSSGPIIAAVLEKDNAVEDFRKFIGATNPANAEPGTIRNLYGVSIQENCVHGSDSDENAKREIKFFFSTREIFDPDGNPIDL